MKVDYKNEQPTFWCEGIRDFSDTPGAGGSCLRRLKNEIHKLGGGSFHCDWATVKLFRSGWNFRQKIFINTTAKSQIFPRNIYLSSVALGCAFETTGFPQCVT